ATGRRSVPAPSAWRTRTARAVPHEHLRPLPRPIDEEIEIAGKRIATELPGDQRRQAVEALPQVRRRAVGEERNLARRADHDPSARTRATTPESSRPAISTEPTRTVSAADGFGVIVASCASVTRRTRRFGARRSHSA